MKTKRELLIAELEECLKAVKDKSNCGINTKIDNLGINFEVMFDDEKPRIKTAEEIVNSWNFPNANSNVKADKLNIANEAIHETHKRYKPLVDKLKDPNFNSDQANYQETGMYFISLIIKP